MARPIQIHVRQIDPAMMPEKMNGPIGQPALWQAVVPKAQLTMGQLTIVVERESRFHAIEAAKVQVRKVLAGRGPLRFKVVESD